MKAPRPADKSPRPLDASNFKELRCDGYKTIEGFTGIDESKLANVGLRLDEGDTLTTKTKRSFGALDKSHRTVQQLKRLPAEGESIHAVLTGAYSLFDFIPAVIALSGRMRIEALRIATLGFSKKNVSDLMNLVDAGLVGTVRVLCSHYFSAADSEIYGHMVEAFRARRFKVVAMRTHAKVLLMQMQDGGRLAIESSANLRSCHNVEQATLTRHRELHDFHARWMDDLIDRGAMS